MVSNATNDHTPRALAILVVLTLIANGLIVALIHRYHTAELRSREDIFHQHAELITEKRATLEQEIVRLEGVERWENTRYVKARQ